MFAWWKWKVWPNWFFIKRSSGRFSGLFSFWSAIFTGYTFWVAATSSNHFIAPENKICNLISVNLPEGRFRLSLPAALMLLVGWNGRFLAVGGRGESSDVWMVWLEGQYFMIVELQKLCRGGFWKKIIFIWKYKAVCHRTEIINVVLSFFSPLTHSTSLQFSLLYSLPSWSYSHPL